MSCAAPQRRNEPSPGHHAPLEQTDHTSEQDDHRPVILVIDDAPAAIEPIVDCLHRADFRTRIATNGERGASPSPGSNPSRR